MFLLDNILLAPFNGILWVGEKINDLIQIELHDEGRIKERMMELQLKFELNEISVEEYDKQEEELLEMIERIRVEKESN